MRQSLGKKKFRPTKKQKETSPEQLRAFCRQKGLTAPFPLTRTQAKQIHLAFTGLTSIGANAEEYPQLFQHALSHSKKRMQIYLACKVLKNTTRASLPGDLRLVTLCLKRNMNNMYFMTLMSALKNIQAHPARHFALYEAAICNIEQAPTIIYSIKQLSQRGLLLDTHFSSFLRATKTAGPVKNISSLLQMFSITRQPAIPDDTSTELSDRLSHLKL